MAFHKSPQPSPVSQPPSPAQLRAVATVTPFRLDNSVSMPSPTVSMPNTSVAPITMFKELISGVIRNQLISDSNNIHSPTTTDESNKIQDACDIFSKYVTKNQTKEREEKEEKSSSSAQLENRVSMDIPDYNWLERNIRCTLNNGEETLKKHFYGKPKFRALENEGKLEENRKSESPPTTDEKDKVIRNIIQSTNSATSLNDKSQVSANDLTQMLLDGQLSQNKQNKEENNTAESPKLYGTFGSLPSKIREISKLDDQPLNLSTKDPTIKEARSSVISILDSEPEIVHLGKRSLVSSPLKGEPIIRQANSNYKYQPMLLRVVNVCSGKYNYTPKSAKEYLLERGITEPRTTKITVSDPNLHRLHPLSLAAFHFYRRPENQWWTELRDVLHKEGLDEKDIGILDTSLTTNVKACQLLLKIMRQKLSMPCDKRRAPASAAQGEPREKQPRFSASHSLPTNTGVPPLTSSTYRGPGRPKSNNQPSYYSQQQQRVPPFHETCHASECAKCIYPQRAYKDPDCSCASCQRHNKHYHPPMLSHEAKEFSSQHLLPKLMPVQNNHMVGPPNVRQIPSPHAIQPGHIQQRNPVYGPPSQTPHYHQSHLVRPERLWHKSSYPQQQHVSSNSPTHPQYCEPPPSSFLVAHPSSHVPPFNPHSQLSSNVYLPGHQAPSSQINCIPSEKTANNGNLCGHCSKEAVFLCSGCQKTWYCSGECQLKAWERHYPDCQSP